MIIKLLLSKLASMFYPYNMRSLRCVLIYRLIAGKKKSKYQINSSLAFLSSLSLSTKRRWE